MSLINSTDAHLTSLQPIGPAAMRFTEDSLEESLSRFSEAVDHLAVKVTDTVSALETVLEIADYPKRQAEKILANPDPYLKKTLLWVGGISVFFWFHQNFEIVSPLHWKSE